MVELTETELEELIDDLEELLYIWINNEEDEDDWGDEGMMSFGVRHGIEKSIMVVSRYIEMPSILEMSRRHSAEKGQR